MKRLLIAVSLFSTLFVLPAQAAEPAAKLDGKAAFEKLKALAGEWEGQAGHGKQKMPAAVTWRVASGGNAVMETLFPGTDHEMISMYYLKRNELVMTHYCAMGNQPRMKLDVARSNAGELHFAFDGGENLDPAKDAHIHSGVIRVKGNGAVEADWAMWNGGKEAGQTRFVLQRKSAAAKN
ncbi:MAG: hypothetical protein WBV82_17965 [Myxococcaceae bacterium]